MLEKWNTLADGQFYLRDVAAFDVAVKGCRFSPPTDKGRISSAFFMIRKGRATYSFDSGSFEVEEGDLVFLPKGAHYSFVPKEKGLVHALVNFDIFNLDGSLRHISDTPLLLIKKAGKGYKIIFDEINKCFMHRSFSNELRSSALVMELIANILDELNIHNMGFVGFERIIPAVTFIEQNCNVDMSTAELADMCDMSESQLRRLFKEYSGSSPVEYRNRLRIEKAYQLLSNHFCNVTEAAEKVGFSNIYYFSRLFKSIMGVAPKSVQMQNESHENNP